MGGVSALGAGLYSIGIPKDSVLKYESALKTDKYVLVVHGVEDEVIGARRIITTTEAAEVALHAAERADQAIAPSPHKHCVA